MLLHKWLILYSTILSLKTLNKMSIENCDQGKQRKCWKAAFPNFSTLFSGLSGKYVILSSSKKKKLSHLTSLKLCQLAELIFWE